MHFKKSIAAISLCAFLGASAMPALAASSAPVTAKPTVKNTQSVKKEVKKVEPTKTTVKNTQPIKKEVKKAEPAKTTVKTTKDAAKNNTKAKQTVKANKKNTKKNVKKSTKKDVKKVPATSKK